MKRPLQLIEMIPIRETEFINHHPCKALSITTQLHVLPSKKLTSIGVKNTSVKTFLHVSDFIMFYFIFIITNHNDYHYFKGGGDDDKYVDQGLSDF